MAVLDITEKNIMTEIADSKVPYLVDFWAPWCLPCTKLSPVIEEIAAEYEGKLKVGRCNVDDERDVAAYFNVDQIPMVMVFVNNDAVDGFIGYREKSEIKAILDKYVK